MSFRERRLTEAGGRSPASIPGGTVSQANGRAGSQRTNTRILLAFGIVACVIGIVFIATNHDLRAAASFVVGVLALAGGFFLIRKARTQ
jgi:uncharacterized membrane protein HdeD (DUF308 family)